MRFESAVSEASVRRCSQPSRFASIGNTVTSCLRNQAVRVGTARYGAVGSQVGG